MTVKVGDKIVITNAAGTRGKYKNGDVLTVAGFLGCNYLEVEEHDRIIDYKEFEVVSEQSAVNNAKLAELESRIAALEAAQPSAQQAQPLKVGDYAKVIQPGHPLKGTIITLAERDRNNPSAMFPFQSVKLNGIHGDVFGPSDLASVTDEEVAEAKTAAKFAEIGRKPGEFKAGDIVKTGRYGFLEVTDVIEGNVYPIGVIINGKPDKLRADSCELITPVERRFDRG